MIKKIINVFKNTDDYGKEFSDVYINLIIRATDYMSSFEDKYKIEYVIDHLTDEITDNKSDRNKFLINCINKLEQLI